MKDRDSSKQEIINQADHHAKNLPSTVWLMTILQAKNTTVGIVATCSRRGPDLEPSITAEIDYYTHGSLIMQKCQWKYLLRPTTSKIAITHHHQLLLQETTWPGWGPHEGGWSDESCVEHSCICLRCFSRFLGQSSDEVQDESQWFAWRWGCCTVARACLCGCECIFAVSVVCTKQVS